MGSQQDQGGGLGQAGPGRAGGGSPPFAASLTTALLLLQIFPLSPGPRWQGSSARPVALALQQALGQELARVRQGSPEVTGIAVRLLQAIATLLSSPHGGALVMSMHRHHFLACPLMRQLCQYQVGPAPPSPQEAVQVPDTGSASSPAPPRPGPSPTGSCPALWPRLSLLKEGKKLWLWTWAQVPPPSLRLQ